MIDPVIVATVANVIKIVATAEAVTEIEIETEIGIEETIEIEEIEVIVGAIAIEVEIAEIIEKLETAMVGTTKEIEKRPSTIV